jgi:hypothetical protein
LNDVNYEGICLSILVNRSADSFAALGTSADRAMCAFRVKFKNEDGHDYTALVRAMLGPDGGLFTQTADGLTLEPLFGKTSPVASPASSFRG